MIESSESLKHRTETKIPILPFPIQRYLADRVDQTTRSVNIVNTETWKKQIGRVKGHYNENRNALQFFLLGSLIMRYPES